MRSPPLISSDAPVMYPARSDAAKQIKSATSSEVPRYSQPVGASVSRGVEHLECPERGFINPSCVDGIRARSSAENARHAEGSIKSSFVL
jgi:hypothetical protein